MTIGQLLAQLEVQLAARKERKMGDYKVVEPTDDFFVLLCEFLSNGFTAEEAQGIFENAYRTTVEEGPAAQGEPVYLYRRLGLDDFVTCDFARYTELSGKTHLFETKILYTSPQPAPEESLSAADYEDVLADHRRLARELDASVPAAKFQLGDHVRKTKGSQWKGRVVGTYSTTLTPEGYAVESDTEKGSVQIYPVGALELVGDTP